MYFNGGKYTSGALIVIIIWELAAIFWAAELIGDSLKNRRDWEDYVVLKKSTRVENSPGDYFAEINLQRMTAGVE